MRCRGETHARRRRFWVREDVKADNVDIVLVRPVRPPNVAAACRAMKNMGLRRLHLVGGCADLDRAEVQALAYRAWDVLESATVWPSLEAALAGSIFVVATSSRPVAGEWSPRRLATEAPGRCHGGRLAVVFGPESSGLSGHELQQCHATVRIRTDLAQPSLNLAQAVLVIAYELHVASLPDEEPSDEPAADVQTLEAGLAHLRDALLSVGFLNAQNPGPVLSEVRRMLSRAAPTAREVTLLRGMARQILWAGTLAREPKHGG